MKQQNKLLLLLHDQSAQSVRTWNSIYPNYTAGSFKSLALISSLLIKTRARKNAFNGDLNWSSSLAYLQWEWWKSHNVKWKEGEKFNWIGGLVCLPSCSTYRRFLSKHFPSLNASMVRWFDDESPLAFMNGRISIEIIVRWMKGRQAVSRGAWKALVKLINERLFISLSLSLHSLYHQMNCVYALLCTCADDGKDSTSRWRGERERERCHLRKKATYLLKCLFNIDGWNENKLSRAAVAAHTLIKKAGRRGEWLSGKFAFCVLLFPSQRQNNTHFMSLLMFVLNT
jgi:hypothetical protein